MKLTCKMIAVIAFAALAAAGKTIAQEVYRWIDEGGQVHFSDRAPHGGIAEITDLRPASGKARPESDNGLRVAEQHLLELSRRREQEVMQARRRFVGKHEAAQSACHAAKGRYDRAKTQPGAAKSPLVKSYFYKMRALCR